MHAIPRLFRFLLIVLGMHLLLFFILRLGLYLFFTSPTDPLPRDELLTAFYLGLKFDLRLSLMMLLPLFVLGGLRSLSPFEFDWARRFWLGLQSILFVIVVLFYVFNFGHYSYLQKPLDASALRFLQNFGISAEMVWNTYPVVWLTIAVCLLGAGYAYLLNRLFNYFSDVLVPLVPRWKKVVIGTVSSLLVIFGLYGKVSYYPLRWSDAFFSTHEFTAAVAMNPVLYFLNTVKNRELGFDEKLVQEYYPDIAAYLGVDKPNPNILDFTRRVTPPKRFSQPPNVVIVIMESFAAYKTGLFGNPLNPTPNIDAIAKQGIFFNRFFTPSTGTARSVWTTITGIPDIETHKTSTRNPLVVNQNTIINAFTDYDKYYFIGGSASWGNIRGLLSSNIPGLHLYEEGSYSSPRMDVWGISDLHLFEEANNVLAQEKKPFFAIIQTSGNHRPYNIPEDNRGFVFRKDSDDAVKEYGFYSNAEFNSYRFMDFSVGFFIEQAKKQKYFDNTIFVFYGDHGLPGDGKHMPPWQRHLPTNFLNVPLVFYAPKLLAQPQVISHVASEVDVLPSLASLAGVPYINTAFGRDLFNSKYDDRRYAFAIEHSQNPLIGVIGADKAFFMRVDRSQPQLHDLTSSDPREDISKTHPKTAAELQRLTAGLYELIRYQRYHNKPK